MSGHMLDFHLPRFKSCAQPLGFPKGGSERASKDWSVWRERENVEFV